MDPANWGLGAIDGLIVPPGKASNLLNDHLITGLPLMSGSAIFCLCRLFLRFILDKTMRYLYTKTKRKLCLFVCLFEVMLYVPVNSNGHVGTMPSFYWTFTQY